MSWDYWALMAVEALLIPAIMIILGRKFMNNPPEKMNYAFGYRSERSMRNKNTWDFAHRYIGRLWFCAGVATAVATVAVVLVILGQSAESISVVMGCVVIIHLIPLLIPVFLTERALKKNFDENGNWRG